MKSTPNRDTIANRKHNHIVKKEAPMVEYNFNLKANAGACLRARLAAVALSGCVAVAAAVPGSFGVQPYAA